MAQGLLEIRRQITGRRQVEVLCRRVQQPDPACTQIQQLRQQTERPVQRLVNVDRGVESVRDLVEDRELSGPLAGCLVVSARLLVHHAINLMISATLWPSLQAGLG
jgi:hypothetical protein